MNDAMRGATGSARVLTGLFLLVAARETAADIAVEPPKPCTVQARQGRGDECVACASTAGGGDRCAGLLEEYGFSRNCRGAGRVRTEVWCRTARRDVRSVPSEVQAILADPAAELSAPPAPAADVVSPAVEDAAATPEEAQGPVDDATAQPEDSASPEPEAAEAAAREAEPSPAAADVAAAEKTADGAATPASDDPSAKASAEPDSATPAPATGKGKGCGCSVPEAPRAGSLFFAVGSLGAVAVARSRRRGRRSGAGRPSFLGRAHPGVLPLVAAATLFVGLQASSASADVAVEPEGVACDARAIMLGEGGLDCLDCAADALHADRCEKMLGGLGFSRKCGIDASVAMLVFCRRKSAYAAPVPDEVLKVLRIPGAEPQAPAAAPEKKSGSKGCGCTVPGAGAGGGGVAALVGLALLARGRKRRG
ncbi:MAG: hypothetical protein HY907_09755 [Deltaproteobacteria bacterium]|nr:hypothetical protein [Deltaproteobacteria bacterium]